MYSFDYENKYSITAFNSFPIFFPHYFKAKTKEKLLRSNDTHETENRSVNWLKRELESYIFSGIRTEIFLTN